MKLSYILRYLVPWKGIFLVLFLGLSFYTVYLLINFPELVSNETVRETIIISLVTGLFGSFLYTFLLWILKPSFIISDKIALTKVKRKKVINTSKKGPEANKIIEIDVDKYTIKVINNSWFFDLHDIKITLLEIHEYPNAENGDKYNTKSLALSLLRDNLNIMPRRSEGGIFKNRNASFAQLFGTEENLGEIFRSKASLEFQIYARHSLSGFAKIQKKKYRLQSCIVNGKFAHGDNFDILNH